MNKRIFFAVNLPEEIKEKINKTFLEKLKELNKKKLIKLVKKENLHFTLSFLGYFPEEKINELIEKVNKIEFNEFEIELANIGSFNNRVIWIDCIKGSKELSDLASKINSMLALNQEKLKAHLTIARNKNLNVKEFKETVEKLKKISFKESFKVKSFHLMESKLREEGPQYFVLKEFTKQNFK